MFYSILNLFPIIESNVVNITRMIEPSKKMNQYQSLYPGGDLFEDICENKCIKIAPNINILKKDHSVMTELIRFHYHTDCIIMFYRIILI